MCLRKELDQQSSKGSDYDISGRLAVIPSVERQGSVGETFCPENNNVSGISHFEKSELIPSQDMEFKRGVSISSSTKASSQCHTNGIWVIQFKNSWGLRKFQLFWLSILGQITSMLQVVPSSRLYMRPIQLYLLYYRRQFMGDVLAKIPVNLYLKPRLAW